MTFSLRRRCRGVTDEGVGDGLPVPKIINQSEGRLLVIVRMLFRCRGGIKKWLISIVILSEVEGSNVSFFSLINGVAVMIKTMKRNLQFRYRAGCPHPAGVIATFWQKIAPKLLCFFKTRLWPSPWGEGVTEWQMRW